jgi:hypothetical protein
MADEKFIVSATKNFKADSEMGAAAQSRRWMLCAHRGGAQHSISAEQQTSIAAMIAYTSNRLNLSEFSVERNLSDRFDVPNPKCIQAGDFDAAIRYLADIISD